MQTDALQGGTGVLVAARFVMLERMEDQVEARVQLGRQPVLAGRSLGDCRIRRLLQDALPQGGVVKLGQRRQCLRRRAA